MILDLFLDKLIMRIIFIIISLVLFYYYFVYRNKLDIFTLAFLCCEFYFMPGWFGFTTRVYDDRTREFVKCSDTLYYVFLITIIFLFIFTLISDKKLVLPQIESSKNIDITLMTNICSFILIVILILFITVNGEDVFGKSKLEYIGDIGVIYQILRYLIPIVFLFAVINKNIIAYLTSSVGIIIDLYMSNRTVSLICIVIFVLFYIYNNDKKHIYTYKKYLIIILLICISFLVFERIIEPIQKKDWTEVNRRIANVDTYVDSIIVSEPFVTQTILEEVIQKNYKVKENTITSYFYKNRSTFNDNFQSDLFPKITRYKMAENIWAEAYANYDFLGILIMSFIYSLNIFILNILILKLKNSIYTPYIYILSANWIFFLHRGSVVNQLTRQKNILLVFGSCLLAAYIFNIARKRLSLWKK